MMRDKRRARDESVVVDVRERVGVDLEGKLNGVIKRLGLGEWTVLSEPDSNQSPRGRVLLESKTILIHDEEPEAAMKTLIHEALEIKLRPMLKPYRSLINALIEWANKQVYEAKERAIEDLIPSMLQFAGEEAEI